MKLNNIYLVLGIVLSICSKILQFRFKSLWGNILILPSAVFFVLAVLLYIPKYRDLFTMMTFGKRLKWGVIFLLPFIVFGGLSIFYWMVLLKSV